jgi:Uma2 family endonuclease
MSTLAPPEFPRFGMPPGRIRRWTVDEYHQMIAAGILSERDRVELLEGWIVPKGKYDPLRASTICHDQEILREVLPEGWRVRVKSAITTAVSEPEPDLAVIRGSIKYHMTRHPEPHEVALVVEESETTLEHERGMKARTYALAKIGYYWIVNLEERKVEVYTDSTGPAMQPAFAQRRDYLPGDAVPLVLAGQQVALIPVADLLLP